MEIFRYRFTNIEINYTFETERITCITKSVIVRTTKSQNIFASFKLYETFTNQISCSYHEGILSY